jgi:hypothetical protein
MRRTLALAIALLPALAVSREPLDIDLGQLGAPDAAVWTYAAPGSPAAQLADDANARFRILASELTLAMTASLLTPGSTTGHSGFDIALEGTRAETSGATVGTAVYSGGSFSTPTDAWPTRADAPSTVLVSAVRIRKALPFSFELGARFKYMGRTSLFAGQLETKWAFFEGDRVLPDFALRIAFTRMVGVRALNLSASEFDFIASKRFGVMGVVSLTPYAALRFAYMRASSDPVSFFPELAKVEGVSGATSADVQADQLARTAAFDTVSAFFFRPTVGVRMTTYALSLALEATRYGGKEFDDYKLEPTWATALRLGFEF